MELKGCFVAIVTPFDRSGAIDEEGLRQNIEGLIKSGVAGVVPCGTTGESATLSWDEHLRVVDIAINQVNGRAKVIAGAGSNNTVEAVKAAQHARDKGADAILCITPYYNKPTQEGLYHHFKKIADEARVPMVLYNVPGRTGVNMNPDTVARLSEEEYVIAVKEASGNLVQVTQIHRLCGDAITILSGEDALNLPMVTCGGKGTISVIGNIVPEKLVAMYAAWENKDVDTACGIHHELLPVCNAMFIETNPIPVKTAMNMMGRPAGGLRLPLVDMSESNKVALKDVLHQCNLL